MANPVTWFEVNGPDPAAAAAFYAELFGWSTQAYPEMTYTLIDTHAGAGLYDLSGEEAGRTGEWRGGVGRLDLAELPEAAAFACFAGTAPWTALCAANALVGFAVLMAAPDPSTAVLPALRGVRAGVPRLSTAIAVCIRNERMEEVLPPLGRLLDVLAARGAGERFALWLLSDTPDPTLAAREEDR